jgi:hypothetical protein
MPAVDNWYNQIVRSSHVLTCGAISAAGPDSYPVLELSPDPFLIGLDHRPRADAMRYYGDDVMARSNHRYTNTPLPLAVCECGL